MYKYLQRFFKFIGPILGTAVVQAAADTLDRAAYKGKPRHSRRYRNYPAYDQMADYARRDVAATASMYSDRRKPRTQADVLNVENWTHEGKGFHDVLLVALDVSGPNAENVQQWIADNMPEVGPAGDAGEIYLDSWWVANDERFDDSDTDSAVFVSKGNQAKARKLLREAGYVL